MYAIASVAPAGGFRPNCRRNSRGLGRVRYLRPRRLDALRLKMSIRTYAISYHSGWGFDLVLHPFSFKWGGRNPRRPSNHPGRTHTTFPVGYGGRSLPSRKTLSPFPCCRCMPPVFRRLLRISYP